MVGESSGEHLTPVQQFRGIIDGHFATVDGQNQTNLPRPAEEAVSLIFTEFEGLLGPSPDKAIACRPIPGQEELARQFYPRNYGHRLNTYASPSPVSSIHTTYFIKEGSIWRLSRRWLAGLPAASYTAFLSEPLERPSRLSDEQVENFLRCLGRAIPVMPETPDPRQT